MRRITTYLFVVATALAVPTLAHAATPSLDPDGQALTAVEPWFDALVQLLLTQLGI